MKNSLIEFTENKFKKDFCRYKFSVVTDDFLSAYCIYIQAKGYKNGNKGGLSHKLKNFKAIFRIALKENNAININIFNTVKEKMKQAKTTPRTIAHSLFEQIKSFDRTKLSAKESLCLDLYLFSYYTAGMANVDVCHLNKSCLREFHIGYTRHKCDKTAYPEFLYQAQEIIEKYKEKTYADYVLPVFNEKQQTEKQKRMKVERITANVNKTLRKIAGILNVTEDVTWYSARGTYITDMINKNMNAYEIADQAGNTVEIIQKHYYRIPNKKEFRDKIAAVI